MNKTMKSVVCLLVIFLLSSAMISCDEVSPGNSGSVTESDSQSESGSGSTEKVKFPLDEPISLNFITSGISTQSDFNELEFFQDLEEKTNIHIEWELVTTGWNEKRSLLFATGSLPDAFFGAKMLSNFDIIKNSSFFVPLEEYIDTYCENIQLMFEEEPETKKWVTSSDGHIYSVPQILPLRPQTRNIMYINNSWLDTLGLELPKTTEDFKNVLRAFKNDDPNGNNKNDEIPFIFDGTKIANGVYSMLGAYGLADNTTDNLMQVRDGEVFFIPTDAKFKEAIQYISSLYSEGLIDSEVFTQAVGQMNAKVRNPGDALVGVGYHWTIEAAINNSEREEEYVLLPPLEGPYGDRQWRPSTIMRGESVAFAVSKNNLYPKETMGWIDLIYEQETGVQLYFGPLGKCLEIGDDGRYTILPPEDASVSLDQWMWRNGHNDRSPIYVGREFEQKINWNSWVSEKLDADKVYAPFAEKAEEFPPYLQFDNEVVTELAMIQSEILRFTNQKVAEWIAKGTIENEYDSFLSELEKMGLDYMIEKMQESYENYIG